MNRLDSQIFAFQGYHVAVEVRIANSDDVQGTQVFCAYTCALRFKVGITAVKLR